MVSLTCQARLQMSFCDCPECMEAKALAEIGRAAVRLERSQRLRERVKSISYVDEFKRCADLIDDYLAKEQDDE